MKSSFALGVDVEFLLVFIFSLIAVDDVDEKSSPPKKGDEDDLDTDEFVLVFDDDDENNEEKKLAAELDDDSFATDLAVDSMSPIIYGDLSTE